MCFLKKSNTKGHFSIWLLMIISSTFYAQKVDESHFTGIFLNEDNNRKITFKDDRFLFNLIRDQEHMSPYPCPDTIAFGTWELDKKIDFVRLQSPDHLVNNTLFVEVTEQVIPDVDSVIFEIHNELEEHLENNVFNENKNVNNREVEYTLTATNLLHYEDLESNKITVAREGKVIGKIDLLVVLTDNFDGWYRDVELYLTMPYEVENPKANHFTINIPDLTRCKVGSRLLNQDFVRVINKNKLEWNGVIYKRNKSINNN